jgi:hypothetical protein
VAAEILMQLAFEFGLPCILRKNILTIIGEKQLLIFNLEDNTCQIST